MLRKVIFFVVSVFAWADAQTDYCSMPCGADKHTMCLYPTPGPAPACKGYTAQPLSAADKMQIISVHNQLRKKVATGQQSPQPKASNMLELTYDAELSTVAQRWADQCVMGHDKCRKSARFAVGQNIAYFWTSESTIDRTTFINDSIYAWFEEVKDTPTSQVTTFTNQGNKAGDVIGHYTQLVWGSSRRVGCAIRSQKDGMLEMVLTCNYGPAGNWLNQPMYKIGCPCSACPSGTFCSATNPGLCSTTGDKNDY